MKKHKTTSTEFFSQFDQREIHERLWEMHKGWLMYAEEVKGGAELLDGVFFYEQLSGLLESLPITNSLKPTETLAEKDHINGETYFKELVRALEILARPEMIFLIQQPSLLEDKPTKLKEVYVVLSSNDYRSFEEIKPLMHFLALGKQEVNIHLTTKRALWKEQEAGDLFFLLHFQDFHLIYQKEGATPFPEVDVLQLAEAKKRAKKVFHSHWKKAKEFMGFAIQAEAKKAEALSLYFLHQAGELLLRGVILAWQNRERKCHEIRLLLKDCQKFIPELSSIFPQDNDQEKALIKLLDDAYCKSRYNPNFCPSEEQILAINKRISSIFDLCEQGMQRALELD
ncbi:HEPN domain-containing protein [Echinicola salinicaeni]|uniref:HEPN domain-containing protein n=1 Tax=Echinicola salinicaeni TaxID=2762757 RepID=UPI001645ED72|nr:HEPN domain-containing protein [Echinicola salinicaeni]